MKKHKYKPLSEEAKCKQLATRADNCLRNMIDMGMNPDDYTDAELERKVRNLGRLSIPYLREAWARRKGSAQHMRPDLRALSERWNVEQVIVIGITASGVSVESYGRDASAAMNASGIARAVVSGIPMSNRSHANLDP